MASFGEELKRERELRDISLKEISEATKISIRFLEALELNNFDVLPGGVFNRGFIRAYARFIGVDGEEMVNAYLHEVALREARQAQPARSAQRSASSVGGGTSEPTPITRAELRAPHRSEIPPETRFSTRASKETAEGRTSLALWALVVLGLLIGVGVITMSLTGGKSLDASAERKSQTPKTSPDKPVVLPPPIVQNDQPASQQQAAVGDLPAGGAVSPSAPGGSDSAPVTNPESQAPVIPEHVVKLRVIEATRVIVECAGKVVLDQELWPGQTRSMSCTEPVLLSADNGGAVEYSLDNGPAEALGEVGEQIEGRTIAPVAPETPATSDGADGKGPHAGN
jgi:cytoskeletal protein RodZ